MLNFSAYSRMNKADYVYIGGDKYSEVIYKRIDENKFELAYYTFKDKGEWRNTKDDIGHIINAEYLVDIGISRGYKPKIWSQDEFEEFYLTHIY